MAAQRNLQRQTQHGNRRKRYNSIASGNLYNSIQYKITGQDDNMELEFDFADYGYWVDQGRKPGPISRAGTNSLIDWMEKKGIDSKYLFPIKRNIEKSGYRATYFFTKAQKEVYKDVDKVLDEYATDLVDKYFEDLE